MGLVLWFHSYTTGPLMIYLGLTLILLVMHSWWTDIIDERLLFGYHTQKVKAGLRLGVLLFILSEVMFFFAFFWSFFALSLIPDISIGNQWPPIGILPLDTFGVPLTNTVLLLTSGVTVTWTHQGFLINSRDDYIIGLIYTVLLAFVFTGFQLYEYIYASFDITDSCFGSTFYMMTGFHGIHVLIGSIFLCVCLIRAYKFHFTPGHHFGFEAAAWYWHFVDVVWLILFLFVYGWGGSPISLHKMVKIFQNLTPLV